VQLEMPSLMDALGIALIVLGAVLLCGALLSPGEPERDEAEHNERNEHDGPRGSVRRVADARVAYLPKVANMQFALNSLRGLPRLDRPLNLPVSLQNSQAGGYHVPEAFDRDC
jgi:hypothetical protein